MKLLDVQTCAEFLGRHPSTIYRRLERGDWPFALKEGNKWLIPSDALQDHLQHKPEVHDADPEPRARFHEMLAEARGR